MTPPLRRRLVLALTRNRAATAPDHPDARLRSRRYGVPHRVVWDAALRLAAGGLRGWSVTERADRDGRIRATSRTPILRFVDDVEIRVGLDEDGQTRVDLVSSSRKGRGDLGKNARRIRRFLARLDREVRRNGWSTRPPDTPPDTTTRDASSGR